jgi:hypothetical protein
MEASFPLRSALGQHCRAKCRTGPMLVVCCRLCERLYPLAVREMELLSDNHIAQRRPEYRDPSGRVMRDVSASDA